MLGPYRLHVNMLYLHFSDYFNSQVSKCQLSGKNPLRVCVGDICALSLLEKVSHATII